VIMMRPCDLDLSGPVWFYKILDHKNAWRGHKRTVPIGPKCQEALLPFLSRGGREYLFSPKEGIRLLRADMRKKRKTKVQPSQKDRSKAKAKRLPGDRYTTSSYYRAVA